MTRKRIHLEGSWVIQAPRHEVYNIITDFENMPKYFPSVAKSVRIISKEDNHLTLVAETKSFGLTFQVSMNTELQPPEWFVSENISTLGIEQEVFKMEEVPEGTKICYINDVEIKSPFFRIFGRFLIGWWAMKYWERAVIIKLKQMLEE
ncbi:SRPBCC family protein [Chloroflexota bacterium]